MGYKKIYQPDHPYAHEDGRVYEHRLIMESVLGRYLEPKEQVHHKDEDKSNNEPSNLIFCPTQKDHSAEHSYGEDELLDFLIRFSDVIGHLPSKRECDQHPEMPHSSTYIRRFGSWSEAKAIAKRRLDFINEE